MRPAATEVLRKTGASGIAWGVAGPEGVERQSVGVAEDAVFEWGSVTKTVTGTLLALLAAEGVVRLDTPLSDVLPGTRGLPLEALASHGSGLPRLLPSSTRFSVRAWSTRKDPYADVDEARMRADLARTRLRPGAYRYSNAGVGLLGLALARAAGSSFEELVQERVCRPLGLHSVTTLDRPELVAGHDRRGRPVPNWHFDDAMAGCGALRGSLADLLTWMGVCAGGAPEPLAVAVREALRPRVRTRSAEVGLGWHRSVLGERLGLRAPRPRQPAMVWHNGGTGGFRSFAAHDEASGRTVAVLSAGPRLVDGAAVLLLTEAIAA